MFYFVAYEFCNRFHDLGILLGKMGWVKKGNLDNYQIIKVLVMAKGVPVLIMGLL